ncbi:hypothetical protein KBG31_00960 [Patescibacteria group bacterium]|nr:hypothetical protein [Patescibacteria group bacterium]
MPKNASSADNQQERSKKVIKQRLFWKSSETTRQISQFDISLAYLLGFLYTDGCLSPKGNGNWRIYFSVTSLTLAKTFRDSALNVFNINSNKVRFNSTHSGYYTVIINSKEIGAFLTENFGCFRTLSYSGGILTDAHLPVKEILCMGLAPNFLRAAFTCDGGVSFYSVTQSNRAWLNRCIFLSCSHPVLRDEYCILLNSIGITHKNDPKDGKIRITSRTAMEEFRKKIGFIEGVEITNHSKNWSGYPKNVVLDYLLDSYNCPSKYLNKLR